MRQQQCMAQQPATPLPLVRALFLVLVLLPALCLARQPSPTECSEAGDFISNAALARDGGISADAFLNRVREDIELIQAFPPHLRWFVQDEEDAQFLLAAAIDVFQKPKEARVHRADFVMACLRRGGGPRLQT